MIACEYCYNFITQFHSFYENVKENQDFLVNELEARRKQEENASQDEATVHVEIEDPNLSENFNEILTETKEEIFVCHFCEKSFKNKTQLSTHFTKCSKNDVNLKTEKPSYRIIPKPHELTVSCDLCPPQALKFKNDQILALHMTEHDRYERIDQSRAERGLHSLIPCPNCERRFSLQDEYESHLKNHESGRLMTCELCGRSIVSSSLKTHLKLHFKRFCCEICSHTFRNRCDMQKHIRLNHDRPDSYECHYCLKRIRYKSALERHLEFCRGPGTVGPCIHCGERFASRSDRMYHVQKFHTGYVCRTCNIQLKGVTALKNHRKSEAHKKMSHEARLRREEMKQEKLLTKKPPLRKVTFGINIL